MADNSNTGASEPNVEFNPGLDQPDDDVVTLDALLDQEQPEAEPGEQENVEADADQQEAESDAPQPDQKASEKVLTQADFNKAFAARSAELRRQFERERAEDFELARVVKEHFNGKSVEEIDEELMSAEARQLAAETGWDEEEALKKVRARHNYMRPGELDPVRLDKLRSQLNEVNKRSGLDFIAIVQADPVLSDGIESGRMDINQAYMAYLENQAHNKTAPPSKPKKAPPPIEKGATAGAMPKNGQISDEAFRKINEALQRGQKVRVG